MAKRKLRFRVKLDGREASQVAAITPPVDVPEVFGTRARVPVRGTMNGIPFRSSLMPMGGCHMMPVNKALRESAGVKAGDIVDVVMERDDEERTVEVPAGLKKSWKRIRRRKRIGRSSRSRIRKRWRSGFREQSRRRRGRDGWRR